MVLFALVPGFMHSWFIRTTKSPPKGIQKSPHFCTRRMSLGWHYQFLCLIVPFHMKWPPFRPVVLHACARTSLITPASRIETSWLSGRSPYMRRWCPQVRVEGCPPFACRKGCGRGCADWHEILATFAQWRSLLFPSH